VYLGEINNQTAKAVFTGSGSASKAQMITHSVWAFRHDLDERVDLADAQAIGTCVPALAPMNNEAIAAKPPQYVDHAIGKGPKWKNKHPKTRK
jgi:Holliday junction resolvasome RuvABC endonuclease subunit